MTRPILPPTATKKPPTERLVDSLRKMILLAFGEPIAFGPNPGLRSFLTPPRALIFVAVGNRNGLISGYSERLPDFNIEGGCEPNFGRITVSNFKGYCYNLSILRNMEVNYKFGQFHLDTASRNLLLGNRLTRLSPRAFDILVLLIKHQGEVVKKEEILNSVWPDSFVEENNLAVHVSALRNVLAERQSGIKHIETVSGLGYRFRTPVIETGGSSRSGTSTKLQTANPELRSIAVLPIVNKNSDRKLDYLADGITDHLIANLSQLSKLKVISYAAVSAYRPDQSNLQEIGFILGVESLLVGSVIEIDQVLEIRVELIRVSDLSQIWGTEYRRKLEELYQTKTEISVALAEKLQLHLSKSETKQISRQTEENPEAHSYYLRGRRLLELRSKESLLESIAYFEEALRLDPRFAAVYAALGFVYTYLALSFYVPVPETVAKAEEYIRAALDIDNDLGEAYAVRGFLRLYQMNLHGAEESFTRAIRLSPNNGLAQALYGVYLMATGNFKGALKHHYIAMDLHPHASYSVALSSKLMLMGEFEKAIENALETIEIFPESGSIHFGLAFCYAHLGNYELALRYVEIAVQKAASTENRALAAYIYAIEGSRERAYEILESLIENYEKEPVDHYDIAILYAAVGEKDHAFNYLEKAFLSGFSHLFVLKIDPRLRILRQDERFAPFLRKIGWIQSPSSN